MKVLHVNNVGIRSAESDVMMLSQQAGKGVEIGLQLRRRYGDGSGWHAGSQHLSSHRAAVAFSDKTGRGAEHLCAAGLADGLAQVKPQRRVAPGLNTRLFFDLIDRRYNKEGNFNMVFTSNKNPALWREDFNEDSTLLCALDRIFDEATVFKLRGESFRGKKLDTVSVQTGKVKAVELLADQQEE